MARAVSVPSPELPPAGRQLFGLKQGQGSLHGGRAVDDWKNVKQANIGVPEAIKTKVYL